MVTPIGSFFVSVRQSVKRYLGKKESIHFRILRETRNCWRHLAGITALSFLSLPLTLLYPLPLKIAVDSALGHQPLPDFLSPFVPTNPPFAVALGFAIGLLLFIAVVTNLQGLASWWLQTYAGEKLVWDFRAQLLNHVQRLPLAFHDRYGTTDCVYRIQHDAPTIQYVTIQGIIPLDRKSTRLNSSHEWISYAVFCLKKKNKKTVTY